MTDLEIMQIALDSGFMVSGTHGQSKDKLMPVSDFSTLKVFAENIIKEAAND